MKTSKVNRVKNVNAAMAFTLFVTMIFVATTLASNAQAAGWSLKKSVDEMTDQSLLIASNASPSTNGSAFVRCDGTKITAMFGFDAYLNADNVSLTYRFDKEPAVQTNWWPSTTGDLIGITEDTLVSGVGDANDDEFNVIRQMMTHSTLLIEATDYQGTKHRELFDLTGASPLIAQVIKACGK